MLTIKAIFQRTSMVSQFRAMGYLRGQDSPQQQTEEIIAHHDAGRFPTAKMPQAAHGPADLRPHFGPAECLRTQERGRGAARHVIASERKEIEKNGQAERDG